MVSTFALLAHRHPTKFAAPDHQGVFEQASIVQILQQAGDWQVSAAAIQIVVCGDVVVSVPTAGVSRVKLHEANSAFDHSSSEQAASAKLVGVFSADAVHLVRGRRLLGNVDDFRSRCLHAEREFVRVHSSQQFRIKVSLFSVLLVQLAKQ